MGRIGMGRRTGRSGLGWYWVHSLYISNGPHICRMPVTTSTQNLDAKLNYQPRLTLIMPLLVVITSIVTPGRYSPLHPTSSSPYTCIPSIAHLARPRSDRSGRMTPCVHTCRCSARDCSSSRIPRIPRSSMSLITPRRPPPIPYPNTIQDTPVSPQSTRHGPFRILLLIEIWIPSLFFIIILVFCIPSRERLSLNLGKSRYILFSLSLLFVPQGIQSHVVRTRTAIIVLPTTAIRVIWISTFLLFRSEPFSKWESTP